RGAAERHAAVAETLPAGIENAPNRDAQIERIAAFRARLAADTQRKFRSPACFVPEGEGNRVPDRRDSEIVQAARRPPAQDEGCVTRHAAAGIVPDVGYGDRHFRM